MGKVSFGWNPQARRHAAAGCVLAAVLAAGGAAAGQMVTPIAKLDADRFIAPWYEITRLPVKKEKRCLTDQVVLYALGDKKNSFQRVTSCKIKGDNSDSWNATGKLDESGGGGLKVRTIWPFSRPYWVLAAGPAYEWLLVGTPNRKSLWVLSKTPDMAPDVIASIVAKASAEGFNTAKLVAIPQHP
ncbi:MAG: lipocalin family protein [Acidobacteriota bacterium]|nr:lipocalin family protein [Acidobacteriota bacterium]